MPLIDKTNTPSLTGTASASAAAPRASGVGELTATLSSALSGVEEQVRAAASQAQTALTSAAGELANNLPSSLNSLFSDTLNVGRANVRLPIKDALASAESQLKKALAGTFVANDIKAQLDTITSFGTEALGDALSAVGGKALGAVAERLGVQAPGTQRELLDLKKLAGTVVRSEFVSGVFSEIGSWVPDLGISRSDVTSALSSIQSEFQSFAGLASSVLPRNSGLVQNLTSYFTPNLPATASVTGTPLAGVPTTTNPSGLPALNRLANDRFQISNLLPTGTSAYGQEQNLFNSLVGVVVDNGLSAAVPGLRQSSRWGSSTNQMVRQQLPGVAGRGQSDLLGSLMSAVGGNRVGGKQNLATQLLGALARDRNLQEGVLDVLDTLGLDARGLFGLRDQPNIAGTPVWDAARIRNSHPAAVEAITGDASLARLTMGREVATDLTPTARA